MPQVVVWDFATGRVLYRATKAYVTDQTALAFSPDDRVLAWGGCGAKPVRDKYGDEICHQGSIITWDTVSGQTLEHAVPSDSPVASIAFSPDGKTIAALDDSGSVVFLDTRSWKQVGTWKGLGPAWIGPSLTFGHDGGTLAVGSGGGAAITLLDGFDALAARPWQTPEQIDQLSIGSNATIEPDVALDPQEDTLAVTGSYKSSPTGAQGVVMMWDIGAQSPPGRAYIPPESLGTDNVLSPDGTRLARISCVRTVQINSENTRCAEGRVEVIDVASGKPAGPALTGFPSDVEYAAFNDTGDRLVTQSCSKWDPILIEDCLATQINVWDVDSGRRARPPLVTNAKKYGLGALALAPNGRTLIFDGGAGPVRWDLVTGQSHQLPGWSRGFVPGEFESQPLVDATAFSPDGRYLTMASCFKVPNPQSLSCGTTEIRIWNTTNWDSSGKPIVLTADLNEPTGLNVDELQFSPDGSQLAIATTEGIRFWDMTKNRLSEVLIPTAISPFDGGDIAYAHSGQLLAVDVRGTDDLTEQIALWDLTKMEQLGGPFISHSAFPSIEVFGRDDATLISSSGVSWDLDPAVWKHLVCQMAGRNLTAAEWTKYVGPVAYQDTCSFPGTPTG